MSAPTKTCLLTTGATSPFPSLISSALSLPVLSALAASGYSQLRVQYGDSRSTFSTACAYDVSSCASIAVTGFDFVESLRDEVAAADLVISHAGSGSILDALRFQKRLIVVPNGELMGGHQKELAEELGRMGYLVEGCLGNLHDAVYKAEKFEFVQFPKPNPRGFAQILGEEVGSLNLD